MIPRNWTSSVPSRVDQGTLKREHQGPAVGRERNHEASVGRIALVPLDPRRRRWAPFHTCRPTLPGGHEAAVAFVDFGLHFGRVQQQHRLQPIEHVADIQGIGPRRAIVHGGIGREDQGLLSGGRTPQRQGPAIGRFGRTDQERTAVQGRLRGIVAADHRPGTTALSRDPVQPDLRAEGLHGFGQIEPQVAGGMDAETPGEVPRGVGQWSALHVAIGLPIAPWSRMACCTTREGSSRDSGTSWARNSTRFGSWKSRTQKGVHAPSRLHEVPPVRRVLVAPRRMPPVRRDGRQQTFVRLNPHEPARAIGDQAGQFVVVAVPGIAVREACLRQLGERDLAETVFGEQFQGVAAPTEVAKAELTAVAIEQRAQLQAAVAVAVPHHAAEARRSPRGPWAADRRVPPRRPAFPRLQATRPRRRRARAGSPGSGAIGRAGGRRQPVPRAVPHPRPPPGRRPGHRGASATAG